MDDDADRWRYTCPVGHRTWEPVNGHFWCEQCANNYADDVEPEFDQLRDRKTNALLDRAEIVLQTRVGSYRDVH